LKKFGSAPSYSKLLADIAKTPSERNRVLRSYFEPNVEEREKGVKAPTKAHKAIAWLVAEGYVRVIITTNFDRLLESALDARGVRPTVLTTPDAIQGALPVALNSCCIVKVHGDYLDTRIRNTPEELAQYDKRLEKFLDRLFDDFGLIVCGWSAEWDLALRSALERISNRRFTTYWTVRGTLTPEAESFRKSPVARASFQTASPLGQGCRSERETLSCRTEVSHRLP
jgi:hypothetical protein